MSRRPARALEMSGPARHVRERRERNRKKRDVFSMVRFLLVLVLVAQGMRVAFTSPKMRLTTVQVTGTRRFTPDQVIHMGHVPVSQNIFRVNLVRVSDSLRQAPAIKNVAVKRELPNTLRIDVEERHPALLVRSDAGAYHADSEGVVFERADGGAGKLPVLEMAADKIPPVGGKLNMTWVRTVSQCAQLAQKEHLAVEKLRVDEGGELWLNVNVKTGDQPVSLPVRMGRAADLPAKFQYIRLSVLGLPSVKDWTNTVKYLNVMCADRPALALNETAAKNAN